MKKLILLILVAYLATTAFVPGYAGRTKPIKPACADCEQVWVIVDKFNSSDRGYVYTLQTSDDETTYTKYALPQPGSATLPPVGAKCTLSGGVFDCGCKYRKLNVWSPIPV